MKILKIFNIDAVKYAVAYGLFVCLFCYILATFQRAIAQAPPRAIAQRLGREMRKHQQYNLLPDYNPAKITISLLS
jgi:hypothetical protein